MGVKTNLYPPVIETYMPGFPIDSENASDAAGCKIYFSLSDYNDLSQIKNAQVTIRNQYTNLSEVDYTQYPSEIMLKEVYEDTSRASDDRYYVSISGGDLHSGSFELNQYYKVQIRFTGTGAEDVSLTTPQAIDEWLNRNREKFSEWSSVCLVRGISKMSIVVSGLEFTGGAIPWTLSSPNLLGRIRFQNDLESDTLNSYQIKLFDANEKLLMDSGKLYSNNYNNINSFNYLIRYNLKAGEKYILKIKAITETMYSEEKTYEFQIKPETTQPFDVGLQAEPDEENGRILVTVRKGNLKTPFSGEIIIRRASSEQNFNIWEEVHREMLTKQKAIRIEWYDNTIKSGVWYKYSVQNLGLLRSSGVQEKTMRTPVMMLFKDIFLSTQDRQLKLLFNPTVSSYKRMIQETKIDTLGSKFPFIRRNGNANYVQLPISGLISFHMDEDNTFTSREELLGINAELYEEFENEKGAMPFKHYFYEKVFRDKVLDFLYNGEVKLFRSHTEGNYLVKIMDVSLTPNPTLGRNIWTFSGTAFEVAEYNVENCKKYGLLGG